MKKRIIMLLVMLFVCATVSAPFYVFGRVADGTGEALLLQAGDDAVLHYEAPKARAAGAQSAEDYIYNSLVNMEAQLNLISYSIPVSNLAALYAHVINSHPELFYVDKGYSYNYYPSTGCAAYLTPQYSMTADEVTAAQEIFHTGAAKALSLVDDAMDDRQKALVLHDYLASEGIYPELYDASGNYIGNEPLFHSAYGFFLNKTVVCEGFTLVYEYLLNQLGIPCVYVGSDGMNHAWNMVSISGSWYHVDITYDNHDIAQGVNTYGSVMHRYFLKSDSYFSAESGAYHYGWETYENLTASDTSMDSCFWDDVISNIYVVDGNYYYLKPTSTYRTLFLKKRTQSGTESNLYNTSFATASLNYSSPATDENGTQHTLTYTDPLARLAMLDDRLYVLAGKKIHSVLFSGTHYEIVSIDQYSNGLGVDESGNLMYQHYNAADIYILDKQTYYDNCLSPIKNRSYNNYPDINHDGVVNAKDYAYILKAANNT